MNDVADYDTDVLLWSERQAALLRGLKESAHGLPNELDLENVAEEIESVGRTEFRAFESYLVQIFVHLLKAASNEDRQLRMGWESEIFTFQIEAIKAMTPSMLRRLDVQKTWTFATLTARNELRKHSETLDGAPERRPFTAEMFLVEEPLDLEPLLAAMREQLARDVAPE